MPWSGDEVNRSLEIVRGEGGAAKVAFHQDFLFKIYFLIFRHAANFLLGVTQKC